jgi:hypothetical protein
LYVAKHGWLDQHVLRLIITVLRSHYKKKGYSQPNIISANIDWALISDNTSGTQRLNNSFDIINRNIRYKIDVN